MLPTDIGLRACKCACEGQILAHLAFDFRAVSVMVREVHLLCSELEVNQPSSGRPSVFAEVKLHLAALQISLSRALLLLCSLFI